MDAMELYCPESDYTWPDWTQVMPMIGVLRSQTILLRDVPEKVRMALERDAQIKAEFEAKAELTAKAEEARRRGHLLRASIGERKRSREFRSMMTRGCCHLLFTTTLFAFAFVRHTHA